jgi:hypothetical protein
MLFLFVVLTITVAFARAAGLIHVNLAIGLICCLLAVAMIVIGTSRRASYLGRLRRSPISSVTLVILLLPCSWMLLQTIPIKGLSNAVWSSSSTALGFPITGSITIDTGATLIAFTQYCAALATAGVVAVLAFDRRVAELTLFLLAFVAVSAAGLRIAFGLTYVDLSQHVATDTVPRLSILATIGIILSCASGMRLHERLRSRRSKTEHRPLIIAGLACGFLGLAICIFALLIEADPMLLFAGFFGACILMGVFVTRLWSLSIWGQSGVIAVLAIVIFAFLATTQLKKDAYSTEVSSSRSQTVEDRMLSDASALGSGAGTFEVLLPVYREFSPAQLQRAYVAAALITVEMGRTFLWFSVFALACIAIYFARRSVLRGRDYAYASAGAGVVAAVLFLIFVSGSDLLGLPASVFVGAVAGLACAQSRSTNENAGLADPTLRAVGNRSPSDNLRDARLQCAVALAVLILTAEAAWLILGERHGSEIIASPFIKVHQTVSIDRRDSIREVATIASVRGDLWAESAFADASLLLASPTDPLGEQQTRGDLSRTLRYAPYRSDVWLTFALLTEIYKWQGADSKALLKMAYYTGPNEANLIPARVKAAFRLTGASADPELRDMIKSDVRIIRHRLPALRPILVDAYKSASVEGRSLEEGLIAELDQDYLKTMRNQ